MGTFTDEAQVQGKWEEGRQRRRSGLTPTVGSTPHPAAAQLCPVQLTACGRRESRGPQNAQCSHHSHLQGVGVQQACPLPSRPLPSPPLPSPADQRYLDAFGIISVITVLSVMNHKVRTFFFSLPK